MWYNSDKVWTSPMVSYGTEIDHRVPQWAETARPHLFTGWRVPGECGLGSNTVAGPQSAVAKSFQLIAFIPCSWSIFFFS